MLFSFECPIAYLEQFDKVNDYHFVLAHMLNNPTYLNFFRNSKKFKILDNGAAELGKSIEYSQLVSLACFINANVVVIPDSWMNFEETQELTQGFLDYLHKGGWNPVHFKLMGVPQGKTEDEWILCFESMVKNPDIEYIGLPYLTIANAFRQVSPYNRDDDVTHTRQYILTHIYAKYERELEGKKIHLLGLGFDGGIEIANASQYEKVSTVDTSVPFALAINNTIVSENGMFERKVEHLNFDLPFDQNILRLALQNAHSLKSLGI